MSQLNDAYAVQLMELVQEVCSSIYRVTQRLLKQSGSTRHISLMHFVDCFW